MKKVPQPVPQTSSLQQLLQKYDTQKQQLQKENQDLQKTVHQQISNNHRICQINQKLEHQIKNLRENLAQKQRQIMLLEAQQSNLLSQNNHHNQEQYESMLSCFKDNFKKMKSYQLRIDTLQEQLNKQTENHKATQKNFRESMQQSVQVQDQLKNIQDQCAQLRRESEKLKQQSDSYFVEIERLSEQCQKWQNKYKDKKKKYKELDGVISQIQIKHKQLMTEKDLEVERMEEELGKQKQEYDKVWRQLTAKNTTIQFQKLQLAKNQQLLNSERIEEQEQAHQREQKQAEMQIRCSSLTTQNIKLSNQIQSLNQQMKSMRQDLKVMMYSYDAAYKILKQKAIKELERKIGNVISPQQIFLKFQKVFEQVKLTANKDGIITRLKEREKELQQELKNARSTNKTKNNSNQYPNKNDEALRLQNQLIIKLSEMKLLQTQIIDLKASTELNIIKVVQQRNKIEELQKKLQKQEVQSKRKQDVYTIEMKKCLNELYEYKNRIGEMKQTEKEQNQFRQAIGSKISVYQKKIKDLLQNLERKEELISKLKQNKKQNESVVQSLYEKLEKAGEFQQLIKKYRHDLSRKDELMNSYKSKYEVIKNDYQILKEAFEKLDKQASTIDKQLQRKNTYINTMKQKYEKQMTQIEKKLKSNSQHTKSISNVMENKLISIKKQCLNYQQLLEDLKKSIWEVIEQLTEKELEVEEKKNKKKKKENIQTQGILKNAKDWEATKVLGLKQSDLEQFINPQEKNVTRKVYQDKEKQFEKIWNKGEMLQYFQATIAYIIEILNT